MQVEFGWADEEVDEDGGSRVSIYISSLLLLYISIYLAAVRRGAG